MENVSTGQRGVIYLVRGQCVFLRWMPGVLRLNIITLHKQGWMRVTCEGVTSHKICVLRDLKIFSIIELSPSPCSYFVGIYTILLP